MGHHAIDDLLDCPPFATPGPGPGFVEAVNACLDILCRRFPRYAEFIRQRTGEPVPLPIRSLEQVDALPALFLPVLKRFQFPLPLDLEVTVRLTSSGTTGAPSVTPLDEADMGRRIAAMAAAYRGAGILAGRMEGLAFLMDPATTQMAGSVVIDAVLRSASEIASVKYLARLGPAGPAFDLPGAVAAIHEAAERGPVLLVGYPALMAAAIQGLARGGTEALPLPAGSLVLTGGGWKSFLPGVALDQGEFQRQTEQFFQVPSTAIRDMFGLSECPTVFVQCAAGNYHIPNFTWAQAVDPESGGEGPAGQTGLLQLTVPLTTSYPLLKILTTDKVSIGRECRCGLPASYLVPRGRVTAARFETCAMKIGRAVA
jgi:hypothetical protein